MKKTLTLLTVLAAALSLSAASPDTSTTTTTTTTTKTITTTRKSDNRDRYSNVYEKVPLEGTYVGYAGVEMLSPSFFSNGGTDFGVVTSHGYMVSRSIFIGGGAGYLADFRHDKGIIPIFAEGRYFFQSQYQRRIYPHIGARAGAAIPTEGKVGFLVQACLGFRIPLAETFAVNIEVGPQYSTKYQREIEHPGLQVDEVGKPFERDGYFFSFFARLNFEF